MNVESIQTTPAYRPVELEASLPPDPPQQQQEDPAPARSEEPVEPHKPSSVIQFAADQVSGEMRMRVVDPESGDVVRQIPPEEMVAISRMLGLLFDRVA